MGKFGRPVRLLLLTGEDCVYQVILARNSPKGLGRMAAGFQEALFQKRKIKTRFGSITQLKKNRLGGGGTLKHLYVTFNAHLRALYWPCMKECYC